MCIHTTHLLFSCGHYVELPTSGKDYVPPKYCEQVKNDLDWYHTQPDRTPEPFPHPAPRPCPLVWGTHPFIGNVQNLPQKHPCAACVVLHGLSGINAIEAQKTIHEPQPAKGRGKQKGSRASRTGKKWMWKPVAGDDWKGLEKVLVDASEAAKISKGSPAQPKNKPTTTTADHDSPSSSSKGEAEIQNTAPPLPAGIPLAALPPSFEPRSAAEIFAFLEEAGRRGLDMYTNYPDTRAPMPQGMVPHGISMAAPVPPTTAPALPPLPPAAHAPQACCEPCADHMYQPWPQYQGGGFFCDPSFAPYFSYGTVVYHSTAPEPMGMAGVTPSIQPYVQFTAPSNGDSADGQHATANHPHSQQYPFQNGVASPNPTRPLIDVFEALQADTRCLSIRSAEEQTTPASPLVCSCRPKSAVGYGDSLMN